MTDAEMKELCDSIAEDVLDIISRRGAHLPRQVCIAIAVGSTVALAVASGLSHTEIDEMVALAWEDIHA